MEMVVLDEHVIASLIAERERLGQDRYDEVHAGRYIVNAAPDNQHGRIVSETMFLLRTLCDQSEFAADTVNVGGPDDFRVTLVCVLPLSERDRSWNTDGVCRVAVEVLSPGEQSLVEPGHYGAHGVGVYIEIDPMRATVHARDPRAGTCRPPRSSFRSPSCSATRSPDRPDQRQLLLWWDRLVASTEISVSVNENIAERVGCRAA